jgi:hypothetical protein
MDKLNVLDRTLPKTSYKKEVALSSFSFLFCGLVEYSQTRVQTAEELEKKLMDIGYQVGYRYYDLSVQKDKTPKRETRIIRLLSYINVTIWKNLYGKAAGQDNMALDESTNTYQLFEQAPLINRFISLPKGLTGLKCQYFNAGVIKGVLEVAGFPAEVKISYSQEGSTVYLITFSDEVMKRDKSLDEK